jgi:predicted RNA-binding protein YlxR (DUF448 family)
LTPKHAPERTCLICRKKTGKENLFRICQQGPDAYVFDEKMTAQARGYYICQSHDCLRKLAKHKKIKVPPDELMKMLGKLKREETDYLNILRPMKHSGQLVFGTNMILDWIENVHFIILASDIAEKPEREIRGKAEEYGITTVTGGTKSQLGDIFGKEEVNAVGIRNKKTAKGLIDQIR